MAACRAAGLAGAIYETGATSACAPSAWRADAGGLEAAAAARAFPEAQGDFGGPAGAGLKRQRAFSLGGDGAIDAKQQHAAQQGLASCGGGGDFHYASAYGGSSWHQQQQAHLLDDTLPSVVQSALLGQDSPVDWEAYAGRAHAAADQQRSGGAKDAGVAGGFVVGQPFAPAAHVGAAFGASRDAAAVAAAATAAGGGNESALLYGHCAGGQGAFVGASGAGRHAQPQQQQRAEGHMMLAAGDASALQRAADHAIRQVACRRQQQLALLRQQQALQCQEAEAAAKHLHHQQQQQALLAQVRQQQQAALMAHQARAASAYAQCSASAAAAATAAAAAAPMSWDSRGAVAQSNASSFTHHAQQQQQQQQAGGLPPRPVACTGSASLGGSRWSGPGVVVMHCVAPPAAAGGSMDSDAGTGSLGLECEEELLSMDMGDAWQPRPRADHPAQRRQQQQQHRRHQHQHQHAPPAAAALDDVLQEGAVDWLEESGSTQHDSENPDSSSEEDGRAAVAVAAAVADAAARGLACARDQGDAAAALVAAKAAALAAREAAAARQSVCLQVLGRMAALRRGAPVLTATPAAAATAGAESARPRLLVTEVSVYRELAAASHIALDQANRLLAKMRLPDHTTYLPVRPSSYLFRMGAAWSFPAFAICLGSSYFQRMLARMPQLAEAALACPGPEEYAAAIPAEARPAHAPRRLSGLEAQYTLAVLRSLQFTCMFLATKVADQVHALGILRFMLSNLSHSGTVVSMEQAAHTEACCLEALGWRLGPFFLEDELAGDDEELWAEAMGHWDYGTDADAGLAAPR